MSKLDAACNVIAQEARDGNASDTIAIALGRILEVVGTDCLTYPMEYHGKYGDHGGIVWEAEQIAVAKELQVVSEHELPEEREARLRNALRWLAKNITNLGS